MRGGELRLELGHSASQLFRFGRHLVALTGTLAGLVETFLGGRQGLAQRLELGADLLRLAHADAGLRQLDFRFGELGVQLGDVRVDAGNVGVLALALPSEPRLGAGQLGLERGQVVAQLRGVGRSSSSEDSPSPSGIWSSSPSCQK